MATPQYITHFVTGNDGLDCGAKFVDKDYVIGLYPDLIPQRKKPILYAWGGNGSGQLGLEDITNRSSPVQVGSLSNWKQISVGSGQTAAVKTDGTLWTWGSNDFGQLGLGDITNRSSPTQVGALTNWKQVSAGYLQTVAVKNDGTIWIWGYNAGRRLGLGADATHRSSPTQIGALTNWKQVSTFDGTMAVKTDGTLWGWGYNNLYGQLGQGTVTVNDVSSPIQIGALTNWKQVQMGGESTLAIKTDGTIWTWGRNDSGQLGLGDTTHRSSPVQVGALNTWSNIGSAPGSPTLSAVKTDGTLWIWGSNTQGQLGLGDTTNRSSPTQVGALTNWKYIVSSSSCLALKTDGTIWSWGFNSEGQLGVEDVTPRSSPVQIGALSNWKTISSMLAISEGSGDF